jgi:hypothetical protein
VLHVAHHGAARCVSAPCRCYAQTGGQTRQISAGPSAPPASDEPKMLGSLPIRSAAHKSALFQRQDGTFDGPGYCESVARNELISQEPVSPATDHLAWRLHKAAMFIKDGTRGLMLRPHRGARAWRLADSFFNSDSFNAVLAAAVLLHMVLGVLEAPAARDWSAPYYADRVPWLLGLEWCCVAAYVCELAWLAVDLRWRYFGSPSRLLHTLLVLMLLADVSAATALLPGTNYVRWSRAVRPFLLLFRSRLLLKTFKIFVRVLPAAAEVILIIIGAHAFSCRASPRRAQHSAPRSRHSVLLGRRFASAQPERRRVFLQCRGMADGHRCLLQRLPAQCASPPRALPPPAAYADRRPACAAVPERSRRGHVPLVRVDVRARAHHALPADGLPDIPSDCLSGARARSRQGLARRSLTAAAVIRVSQAYLASSPSILFFVVFILTTTCFFLVVLVSVRRRRRRRVRHSAFLAALRQLSTRSGPCVTR